MIEITLTTPAIVFPALSVLMLAYTNRFIAISKRVRVLHAEHRSNPNQVLLDQIKSLRKRLILIRNMQISAIIGFLLNMISIGFILFQANTLATYLFGIGLIFIVSSLLLCIIEIYLSVHAMSIQLADDLKD